MRTKRTEQNRTEQNRTEQNTNTLYCPHIKHGQDWQTSVYITNLECSCKQKWVRVNLSTHDKNGVSTGIIKHIRKLKANETKVIDPQLLPSRAASLKIASNGNLISHAIYQTNDGKKSEVVPAIKAPSKQQDFPILIDYEDVFIYETITLLNPDSTPAGIEIIALDRNGDEIDRSISHSLVSWESNTISLIDIFGPEILKDISTVRVISDTNIAGIQLVDYPEADLVGLPALTTASKGWLFPIATEGGNQALWTRVGVINPGGETADIHVETFDANNNSLGVIDRHSLLPGALYFTSTENISTDGGVIPLNTAYIKVTADRPVSGYEVIGLVNGIGLSAVMGIPDEDHTTAGFEIRGSSNGEMLNVHSMVKMGDGSVKSMAGSLGDEEWQIQLKTNTFITSDLQRRETPYTSNDLISASYDGSCGTPPAVLRKVRSGAKVIYLNPSNEDKSICVKSGCTGNRECDQMRQIAVMLADILYNSGYTVIIDYDQFDAGCRANKESPKPDIFVTLHSNATTGGCNAQASGPETYWEESQDEPLASNIQGKLVGLLKQNGYTGTANTNKIIYWRTKAYPSGALFKGNINVGDSVKVTALGNGYNIRDNPCGSDIGNLRADDIGVVKDGPRRDCRLSNGSCYTWWKIDWKRVDQKDGWSVDFEHYGVNGGRLLEKIPHTNINPAWPNWYIAGMPACLVEVLYHDNGYDSEWLCSKQQILAQGIANGIMEFFGDTPQCSSGKFKVGDCVRVTGAGNEGLCVREKPCRKDECSKDTVCPKLCNASEGSTGKVMDGCVYADGYTWWKIQWDSGDCSGKTGWGVENYLEKITCPNNLPNLSVTPSDGLTSSGNQGGPFTPSNKSYTLQNTGGSSISWTASKGQGWVTLSSTSGTLRAGESTTVTVSINSNANSLTPNTYNDMVSFTNTTNGNGNTTRPVSLTVTLPPDYVASFGGTVTDVNTGSVISGASVTWGSYYRTTDGSGNYRFDSVSCQMSDLIVSKSGYQTYSQSHNPPCNQSSVKDVPLTPVLLQCVPPTLGLTIITHGFDYPWPLGNGALPGWVREMAHAITYRVGAAIPIYRIRYDKDTDTVIPQDDESGRIIDITKNGGAIILLDWVGVANETLDYPTQNVANRFFDYLFGQQHKGHYLAELPIHLIGHSRGGSLNSRLAHELAGKGILVEQVTSLDPHPVTGASAQDWPVTTYINTIFADNYYRTGDGGPDGKRPDGAFNSNLTGILTDTDGNNAHTDVHTYYHGTIDLNAKSVDDRIIQDSWYEILRLPIRQPRDQTGYYFSRYVQGSRDDTDDHKKGLHPAVGGPNVPNQRTSLDKLSDKAYPNVGTLPLTTYTYKAGDMISIPYYYQDADTSLKISFYLDNDTNPYNGYLRVIRDPKTKNPSAGIIKDKFDWNTLPSDAGTYAYVQVKAEATDSNNWVHYDYLFTPITINAESTAPDLTALSVTAPAKTTTGETIPVVFTVKNLGNGTTGNFVNRISLATSAYGTQNRLGDFPMTSFAPNESRTETKYVTIPASTSPGNYWITVYTDGPFPGSVKESNEDNNIGSTAPSQINIESPAYTITASAGSNGSISPSGSFTKAAGTDQKFTATPSAGYMVNQWTLDGNNIQSGGTIYILSNIQANHIVSVTFTPITYTLNVSAVNGSVNKNPDQQNYIAGTEVILTPIPANGYRFSMWTGDASGSDNPLKIKMDANKYIVANFTKQETGSIRVSIEPQEAVYDGAQWRLIPESIWRNSGTIKYDIPFGTYQVEFKTIDGWITPPNKEVKIFAGQPDILIDSDPYIRTAVTTRTLTVASSNPNNGVLITVSQNDKNGQGNGTTPFTRVYDNNTTVTLAAPLTAGDNNFQKWQRDGSDAGFNTEITVNMDADHTMTAVYVGCVYSLSSTSQSFNSSGGSSSVGVMTSSSSCSWTATSNAGWITITSGSNGTGDGTVSYSVLAYTGTSTRTETMTIEGQTFTVTQYGILTPTPATPKITAGGWHTATLKSDGTVWAWGGNWIGQLGDGSTTKRTMPVQVSGLNGVTAIASQGEHTLALKSDSTVWAWGNNWDGQLGDGSATGRTTPVQVSGLSGVTAISPGYNYSIALKSNGTVWTWGDNQYGQLGNGTTVDMTTPVQVSGLSNVSAIAGGYDHGIALKFDGTVWTWGRNNAGQLGDGSTIQKTTPVQVSGLSGIIAVAGGQDHTLALKSDGTVWAWGKNSIGQLGDGTTNDRTTPVQMSNLSDITAIAGGGGHTIALKPDGTVWTCGAYGWANNGNGWTFYYRLLPEQVTGINGIVAIDAGWNHLVVLKPDGTVWTWGDNYNGQLGDGTTTDRNIPVQVDINLGEMTIPPMLATGSASNITSNAATLNGTVNANGLNTKAWFEYGTTSNSYPNKSSVQSVSGSSDTAISIGISGLLAGTNCYYRIAAQNSAGTRYGSEISFTTLTKPPVTHDLTVASSNPNSGVSITVSPNDNDGLGNGTTQFTRTYNNNTSVTLTAPSAAGGNSFQKWQRNGVDLTTSQTANVAMDANYTMTAVYATFPSPTPTPTPIRSIRLEGDLSFGEVQVGGSAQRTMTIYNDGNSTLNVSSISYPSGFSGNWSGAIRAGSSQPVTATFSPTDQKTYSGNVTVTSDATSGTNTRPVSGTGTFKPICTLTVVSSNPNSGVSITVSPNDNNGLGNGTTQFTRTYNNNTSVTLTAPPTEGGNSFQKWQRNGGDLTTSQTANVTMDANYTMMAVYATFPSPTPTPTPGMTGNIAGQVTDATTGAGINGATVTLNTGESTTSGSVQGQNGVYSITGISVGQHEITASGSNYATSSQTVTVVEGSPNPQTGKNIFNFTLTPTPTCNAANLDAEPEKLKLKREGSADETVTVTCENGEPKAGILVTAIVRNGKKRVSVSPSSAVTDTNGQATFTITARKKTGNAKVSFVTAGGLRDSVYVKVSK